MSTWPPPPPKPLKEKSKPQQGQQVPDAGTQGILDYIQAHAVAQGADTSYAGQPRGNPDMKGNREYTYPLNDLGTWGQTGGGGGGAGGAATPPAPNGPDYSSLTAAYRTQWKPTYSVPGAPSWWKGLTPDRLNPLTEYATIVNALVPYMSPEDQRTAAENLSQLSTTDPSVNNPFAGGKPTATVGQPGDYSLSSTPAAPLPPVEGAPTVQYQYFTANRAQGILDTLNSMAKGMGKSAQDFGPGYQYLKDIASVMQQYGGAGNSDQTRGQYLAEQAALDPILAQSQGTTGLLSAYGPAAEALINPFTGLGPARDATKQSNGQWQFERPNPWLGG